ncbi:MAG: carboxypeptidase-like regulatory domain-containing protein [Nitrospirota bacterium]
MAITYAPGVVSATHEVDHRFTVEGFVCGSDGKPVAETQVIVKDTRASVGVSVYTDSRGYYKATLHLHNDNRGDPILVSALQQEQRVTAQFDPKDVETERLVKVTIGSGCETAGEESSPWVYYGAGIGIAAVAALAGARFFRKRQRSQGQGKRQRK